MSRLPLSFLALISLPFAGEGATPEEIELFEKHVRPVLVEQCYKCHGPEKQKSELRVDSRAALLKGSDQGPAIVPGKPEESALIKSIRHEGDAKMPEKAPKLSDPEIAALTEWVKLGAPWPENEKPLASAAEEAAKKHWAYQPVRRVAPPTGTKSDHPIDAFLLAKLEPAGLGFSPRADKRTLLRRATFDLTGLPPTSDEVAAFDADESPEAFAKVVDRLLASPRYGERWGRYWLDVARYADSKGYVFQEERKFPYAYTYRDWVIRALNEDLPYDQFIIQQLAADFIVTPEDPRPLAAMGFLTVGRRFLNNINDIIDDRIDLIGRGLMGLTIACARCHDHKFDPISQRDYYALHGVFSSSKEPPELPTLPAEEDREEAAKYQAEYANRKRALDHFLAQKSADISLLATLSTGVPLVLPSLGEREGYRRLITGADRDRIRELRAKIDQLNATAGSPPRAMVLVDAPVPVQPRVFIRGNPGRPGEEVERRFVSVLAKGDPAPFKQGSGRLELARAIASADNPLTTRVFVNRVWARHFGRGLVRTPGDFGVRGEPPTHPELLDWLATRFVEDGWSPKKLHRLLMLSDAYQQSSDLDGRGTKIDPENRLVWRQNRQRLDFEAMRDSLLFVAGQLDLKTGGRPVELAQPPYAKRRAVYGFIDRQNLPGLFRTFDFASPDATSAERYVTTVPQQALFMLNSPFVIEQARALVSKPDFGSEHGISEWQVHQLYERVYARRAEAHELEAALRFMEREKEVGKLTAWEKYAQVLVAGNEFVFVD